MGKETGKVSQILKRSKSTRRMMAGAIVLVAGFGSAVLSLVINAMSGLGYFILIAGVLLAGAFLFYSGYSKIKKDAPTAQAELTVDAEESGDDDKAP
jgi:hypothetical protein